MCNPHKSLEEVRRDSEDSESEEAVDIGKTVESWTGEVHPSSRE